MSLTVERLTEDLRPALLAHFLSLPPRDRGLRFGTMLRPHVIARYVERLDFAHDAVFGAYEDDLALAGVAHVAFEGYRAELSISVLPRYRRRGMAAALFRRAIEHARNRSMPELVMQYLSSNAAVMRLARRFGMDIAPAGVETYARLQLVEPSIGSVAGEWLADALASCGGALKAFAAGWRSRRARRAAP